MEPIKLNGVNVYPFRSAENLMNYVDSNPGILVAINAEKVACATDETRTIINNNIGYCDGSGVVMALKRKGFKDVCKIAGCELWLHIIRKYHSSKRFYLIGGKPEIIEETVAKLAAEFPGIQIVGHRNGYFNSEQDYVDVIDDIVAKQPDVVFVAMGSPKQELFMQRIQKSLPNAIYQGLGGSFDVYTGHVKRAPKWWIDHNLEFAYRVVEQPSRIGRQKHILKYFWMMVSGQL